MRLLVAATAAARVPRLSSSRRRAPSSPPSSRSTARAPTSSTSAARRWPRTAPAGSSTGSASTGAPTSSPRSSDGALARAAARRRRPGFDSSWPRIGAGDGGRLVVTWVQEFGVGSDRMFSAALDPGASRFQAPVPVDLNVGEATATYPVLAMARGGQAYLVYRVVTDTGPAQPARLRRRRGARRALQRAPLVGLRHAARPQRRGPGPAADRRQRAARSGSTSRATGSSPGRSPTTTSSTASGRGGCSAASVGIPLQVEPVGARRPAAARPADAFALDVARLRPGRGRVPPAARPGRRADGAADLRQRDPRRLRRGRGSFAGPRLVDGAARGGARARRASAVDRDERLRDRVRRRGSATLLGDGRRGATPAPASGSTTAAAASPATRSSTSPRPAPPSPPGAAARRRGRRRRSQSGAPTASSSRRR